MMNVDMSVSSEDNFVGVIPEEMTTRSHVSRRKVVLRKKEKQDINRLIQAALQKIPCDLTIENAQLVNVITGEIYPANVDVLDGIVVRIREEGEETSIASIKTHDAKGAYLAPGFIDSHIHVESTMMIPQNLSRAITPWGTTTICTDPHEIANVMGMDGVDLMLEDGKKSSLRHLVLAPSCVPSVPGFESTGAEFTAKEVGELLEKEDVIGIAEIMDFVNVIRNEERMSSIIEEGRKRNVFLQGHAPLLKGKELAAYRLAGPKSDHESMTFEEVREKLRNGIHVNLRASSLGDNLVELTDGFKDHRWCDFVSICTDDLHAKDILDKGHINWVGSKAIKAGIEPIEVIKMATLNAAREFQFDDLGAIAPGYKADMQLLRSLDLISPPEAVFIGGKQVAENGRYIGDDARDDLPHFFNTVRIPQIERADDFRLKAPEGSGDEVSVAVLTPCGIPTLNGIEWMTLPVKNGYVELSGHDHLSFVAVVNRYGNGRTTIAVIKDSPLTQGAYGSTVSHDCHNLTILYKNHEDAYRLAKLLEEIGGGIAVVNEDQVEAVLELPVAGLMSPLPAETLSAKIANAEQALEKVSQKGTSILLTAVMSLACIPAVVLTDYGIVDGLNQTIIEGFR